MKKFYPVNHGTVRENWFIARHRSALGFDTLRLGGAGGNCKRCRVQILQEKLVGTLIDRLGTVPLLNVRPWGLDCPHNPEDTTYSQAQYGTPLKKHFAQTYTISVARFVITSAASRHWSAFVSHAPIRAPSASPSAP